MSEEQNPDTTEAVSSAIIDYIESIDSIVSQTTSDGIALVAIAAHNEELARLGYVTVKPVQIRQERAEDENVDVSTDSPFEAYAEGYNDALFNAQNLGMPIEVIE